MEQRPEIKTAQRGERELQIPVGRESIAGTLVAPEGATALVLFAHGSGSSRFSVRNRYVSDFLNREGLATLLLDLLTSTEAQRDAYTGQFRFDIELLAGRLVAATQRCQEVEELKDLPIGYFGASTGAAAALIAAVESPVPVGAVVSRGGRPDLAWQALPQVHSPTLLIVGSHDPEVIEMNQRALARISGIKALEIVPGATHLFEEPGTLERVAELARDWFLRYLRKASAEREAAA